MIDKILECFPEEKLLLITGFDEAIIGINENTMSLIYSQKKCIEILINDMTKEEAIEYFYYNIKNAYLGEKTPIFCTDNL